MEKHYQELLDNGKIRVEEQVLAHEKLLLSNVEARVVEEEQRRITQMEQTAAHLFAQYTE
jgi:hypothetical protein